MTETEKILGSALETLLDNISPKFPGLDGALKLGPYREIIEEWKKRDGDWKTTK